MFAEADTKWFIGGTLRVNGSYSLLVRSNTESAMELPRVHGIFSRGTVVDDLDAVKSSCGTPGVARGPLGRFHALG